MVFWGETAKKKKKKNSAQQKRFYPEDQVTDSDLPATLRACKVFQKQIRAAL